MKFFDAEDGLDGYIIFVEEDDLKKPLDLPQVKGEWDIIINNCEGIYRVGTEYRFVYITNNEFSIEFRVKETESQNHKTRNLLILQR